MGLNICLNSTLRPALRAGYYRKLLPATHNVKILSICLKGDFICIKF